MKKFLVLPAVATATVLALTACGSGNPSTSTDSGSTASSTSGGDSAKLTDVSVGTLPILPTAVIQLGMAEGIFEKNGLNLTLETGQGGAALLPAVMSGSMDFATGNPISLLQARDKGLDVRVVSSYTYDTKKGVHAVLAKKDSPIASAKDLVGKKVAINTLKSMGDLTIMEAVSKDGGDPKKVTFVEMPYPNMEQALDRGDVDAVWTPEPFMTIISSGVGKVVSYPGVESVEGHPTMMFFSSGAFIKDEPETVKKMSTAINAAMDFATANPQKVRDQAVKTLKLSPALAPKVVLEDFGGPVRTDVVKQFGALMDKYKILGKPADVDGLLQSVPAN